MEEYKKALNFLCEGVKLAAAATVLWGYAIWLVIKFTVTRITDPP